MEIWPELSRNATDYGIIIEICQIIVKNSCNFNRHHVYCMV